MATVSERQLRSMSRMLRAQTAAVAAGSGGALALAWLTQDVRRARSRCEYDGGLYGIHYPTARRYRRTMEDAKQTVRRAEIVLSALLAAEDARRTADDQT